MTKKFDHPLMVNNITRSDRYAAANFIKNNVIFTQSKKVIEFEKKWAKWLGVKYSVFVNSGSSANYLTMLTIKILYGLGEVIVPPLTWSSDIVSVINNNFKPIFVDINLSNLSMNSEEIIKKINRKTKVIFLTHAQGFNGLNDELLKIIKKKKIILIEDVCESHGATHKNKKLGTFGLISNFSFYYAHHLSTIEGGMICTNNKKIYETAKMLRGHGMLRESGNKQFENNIIKKNRDLSPKFIFLYAGFNMRNNEISAVIGLNQLKRLNRNNKLRSRNFKLFLSQLDKDFFYTNYDLKGNSNYAFPIILKKPNFKLRDKLENIMQMYNIEFRRGNAGGGNQLRQPYLKKYVSHLDLKNFQNVEHVHHFGYYIGNFPSLKKKKIFQIASILNKVCKTNYKNNKNI
jgi:CDP-6-deoxy-D-xylo-4-hexulose-3-dehydrase